MRSHVSLRRSMTANGIFGAEMWVGPKLLHVKNGNIFHLFSLLFLTF